MDARIKAVTFDEEAHRYFYNGRELHGITGVIGKMMGKSFPKGVVRVDAGTIYGSDVHKEIENYFNQNGYWFNHKELSTEGAKWIVDNLKDFCSNVQEFLLNIECEVMVSDFEGTASKVDIVVRTRDNKAYLFDIKTTSTFDRAYCSLQLSCYKRLFEACYNIEVKGMYVLSTKQKRLFKILEQSPDKVQAVLNKNKGE